MSCLVVLTGAFGIFGACSDNKCLLHTFWILLTIWLCGFIAAGVVAVLLPNKVLGDGCLASSWDIFQSLNTAATKAGLSDFCMAGCPCYVANSTGITGFTGISTTDSGQAKNVQACTSWPATNADSAMAGLELAFTCSGWCPTTPSTVPQIFYFSNNNEAGIYEII